MFVRLFFWFCFEVRFGFGLLFSFCVDFELGGKFLAGGCRSAFLGFVGT